MLLRLFAVGIGGAVGSATRYLIALALPRPGADSFPWATFTANVLGCFLLQMVLMLAAEVLRLSVEWRLALTTGFMGGFTTYSTFNAESSALLRSGAWKMAVLYMAVTVVACLFAGLLGGLAGRAFAPST